MESLLDHPGGTPECAAESEQAICDRQCVTLRHGNALSKKKIVTQMKWSTRNRFTITLNSP